MGRAEPAPAEVLYRRGRTSTMCTLILTGKVVVLAGRDGACDMFLSVFGGTKYDVDRCRWSLLLLNF